MRKLIFFLIYILTSVSIILLAFNKSQIIESRVFIAMILVFFMVALSDHFKELSHLEKKRDTKENINILIGTFLSASITWYISHAMGYGPIVANGLIGVTASMLFSSKLAGSYYIASFVGMSGIAVMPSMLTAGIAGIIAGVVIILSQEVYSGMGGKGGTIATLSTGIIRGILYFFI